jgi:uncharacterized protein (DUF302 family)
MLRALAVVAVLMLPAAAHAQTMKSMASNGSVPDTVERLVKAIEGKGAKIAARIDHAAGAKAVGAELAPSVLVIFGNPKLGTPLMQADPRAGLDLPMRMLVWQDKAGKVWVGYTPPATLQARYGLKGKDAEATLKTMAGALEAFAKEAAGASAAAKK